MMLSIAIQKEQPLEIIGQPGHGVMEGGGLAVLRSGQREDFGPGFFREESSVVSTGVIDDENGKTSGDATADNMSDGGGFVAGGDEDEGGAAHDGISWRSYATPDARRPRECILY